MVGATPCLVGGTLHDPFRLLVADEPGEGAVGAGGIGQQPPDVGRRHLPDLLVLVVLHIGAPAVGPVPQHVRAPVAGEEHERLLGDDVAAGQHDLPRRTDGSLVHGHGAFFTVERQVSIRREEAGDLTPLVDEGLQNHEH